MSNYLLAQLSKDATVILVYDVDVSKTDVLKSNIKKLHDYGIKEIYHVQSIKNFEDEILNSTTIKDINDLFSTSKVEEFKKKFINHRDILSKLKSVSFDVDKIWSRKVDKGCFFEYADSRAAAFIHVSKKR